MNDLQSLINKLRSLIKHSAFKMSRTDDGVYPVQDISYMGKEGPSLVVMPYGTSANVPPNYFGLTFSANGQHENRVTIPASLINRKKDLVEGEWALFSPLSPDDTYILFKEDGTIEIKAPTIDITADVNIIGNVVVTGDITASGTITGTTEVKVGAINLSLHKHTGVVPGGGTSGGPTN